MGALEKFLALAGKAKNVGKDAMLGKEVAGPGKELDWFGSGAGNFEPPPIEDMGRLGGLKDLVGDNPKMAAALGGGALGAGAMHEGEDDDSAVNELLRKLGLK